MNYELQCNAKYPFMNFMYKTLKNNSATVEKNKHCSTHFKKIRLERTISKSWDHFYLVVPVSKTLEKESGH